jgi:hypothetical protein
MIRAARQSTQPSLPYSRDRTNADWCYSVLTRLATVLGDNWVTIVHILFYNIFGNQLILRG